MGVNTIYAAGMGKFCVRFAVLVTPVAVFAYVAHDAIRAYTTGTPWFELWWVIVAALAVGLWEGIALRAWVLPLFARAVGNAVYGGGHYSAADDAPVALAERIRAEKDREMLAQLYKLVRQDAGRSRCWSELADVLLHVFADPHEAVAVLVEGADCVSDAQDRAMLLFRAAGMRYRELRDSSGARELYELTAQRFPRTVYGQRAARLMRDSTLL